MRKFLIFAAVLLLGTGIALVAQEGGGFTGPGLPQVSVKEAKKLIDDTPVLLRGHILRFLGDEKYLFSDDTGTVTVEIDDSLWRNLSVSEQDKVEIVGEVDKKFLRVEIDVDSIKKLQ